MDEHRPQLGLALSPYHLTTGEPPALLACVLGDRVVTLMPEPFEGTSKAEVARAVTRSPRYLRLMEAWRWSMPLWKRAVITSSLNGRGVAESVFDSLERIAAMNGLDALRAYMRPEVFSNQDEYLEAVAGDLLKGGPDPAISVPLSAGLDAFAAEHGLAVVRAGIDLAGKDGPPSMAHRAEASLGRRIVAWALPIPMRASGSLLGTLRDDLAPELDELRAAIAEALAPPGGADESAVGRTAQAYSAAFEHWHADPEHRQDEQGLRAPAAWVSVTAVTLPVDAVVRSSAIAAHAVKSRLGGAPAAPAVAADSRKLIALVVRRMGIQPGAGR